MKKVLVYGISDLHLEFRRGSEVVFLNDIISRFNLNKTNINICCLVGDIFSFSNPEDHIEHLSIFKEAFDEVLYVAGNHEYYCPFEKKHVDVLLEQVCKASGVHYLNNSSLILHNIRFIGTTLWTNITPQVFAMMGDSRFMSLYEYMTSHKKSVEYLSKELEHHHTPTVVLTHHLPSFKLVHPRFEGHPALRGFVSNLDFLIQKTDLWICGHTHENVEMYDANGNIQVIANPVGRPDEHRVTSVYFGYLLSLVI